MQVMNSKDFAIGVLSVTAVVLFVGLLILGHVAPQQAVASGQGGMTGDYVVSSAHVDDMTEAVFVTDTLAQEMNMYVFLPARGTLELVQKFDLRALEVRKRAQEEAGDRDERGERDRGNRRTR